MLDYIIPLLSSFINPEYLEMWCYPLFMLYFIASTPGLIRQFTKWG